MEFKKIVLFTLLATLALPGYFLCQNENEIDMAQVSQAIESLNVEQVKQLVSDKSFNSKTQKNEVLKIIEEKYGKYESIKALIETIDKNYGFFFIGLPLGAFHSFVIDKYYIKSEDRRLQRENDQAFIIATAPQNTQMQRHAFINAWAIKHTALQNYNNRSWLDKYGKKYSILFAAGLLTYAGLIWVLDVRFRKPKLKKLEEIKKLMQEVPVNSQA